MSGFNKPVELRDYLWTRLSQIGVRSVHGLPGDYNLNILDTLSVHKLHWVGNCNEMNAGYAADAYARVKGISALVTTGGVGELSAINAHACAYTEYSSIIHIVGSPALRIRGQTQFSMHHTLANGRYDDFKKMFTGISAYVVTLDDAYTAPKHIDEALRKCWIESRPVYIEIPSDMGLKEVDGTSLEAPLDLSFPKDDPKIVEEALSLIAKSLEQAQRPCILLDLICMKLRIDDEVRRLVQESGLPTFETPLAHGFLNGRLPNHGGLYAGLGSNPGVQEFLEASDLVLHIGCLNTDVTTFLGTAKTNLASRIFIDKDCVRFGDSQVLPVSGRSLLLALLAKQSLRTTSLLHFQRPERHEHANTDNNSPILQSWLWPWLGSWLNKGDIVLTDTGTASFGIFDTVFPEKGMLISISLWASIGHSLPASQGAALAARDAGTQRRTILFQGDGSFQLTCQEISTMVRNKLSVIMFIICNDGYTIERAVHPTEEDYNDVAPWNYAEILNVFDANRKYSRSFRVKTGGELTSLLQSDDFLSYSGVQLVEIHTGKLDIPLPLQKLSQCIAGSKKTT